MPGTAPDDLIQVRIENRAEAGRIAWVTVNNPAKRNTLGIPGKRAIAAYAVPDPSSLSDPQVRQAARAQQYPAKPVRYLVPHATGGGIDIRDES